jgi:DNA-directed RNA polymerase subunit RPC12/RpoP
MADSKITKRYVCDEDLDKCDTEFTVTTARDSHLDIACPVCGSWATEKRRR